MVVNSCCVTAKARKVPVFLINTTEQNIWVRQPLLATELFEVEVEPQQYHTEFNHEGDEITFSFLPVPPHEGQEQVENNAVEVEENNDPPKEKISQKNTQNLGKGLTLVRPMILKKKLSGYLSSSIWGMLLLQKNNRIDC